MLIVMEQLHLLVFFFYQEYYVDFLRLKIRVCAHNQ